MAMWDKVKKALIGDKPETEPKKKETTAKPAATEAAWGGGSATPDTPTTPGDAADAPSGDYKKVKVSAGGKGWGGPLIIEPKPGKDLIYSVTGGGIHPIAQKIADLSGGRAFDGFNSSASFDQIACAVIDCGGTARVGVYPMKKVPTIDIYPTSPSGPLSKFITEDIFVSGVKIETIELAE
ncbi:MAG: hypothetical protein ACOC4I_02035 [Spirochaetota bacterium]